MLRDFKCPLIEKMSFLQDYCKKGALWW